MKKRSKWLLAGLLCIGIWSAIRAEDDSKTSTLSTSADKPAVLDAAVATLTATVTSIDYKTRAVTLKGKDGNEVSMIVGPEVTRLDQVKKGDVVEINYLESVAVVVQAPSTTIASAEGSSSVIVRNVGKKPSGMKIDTDIITATVVKIDAAKRTATLKGPTGNTLDVDIAPDVTNLENVKKGDQILVKVTRTVALDIHKPKK